jgi:lipopolysaccharide/colanic/teichoic acid biosynthesis glycosyltransferase
MDILLSGMALLAFLPAGLLISLVLRLTGEGEVFYYQTRIGLEGREFRLIKFATMLKRSPSIGPGLITVRNDPRVLPVGRILRMTKLNEVPQLINILIGDMSIIGPRPLVRGQYEFLPDELKDRIYSVRPGLSGIGSLVFRDEEKLLSESPKGHERCFREDIMPCKAKLELWYTAHASLWMDCLIILATMWAVLVPRTQVHRILLGKEWEMTLNTLLGSVKE